MDDAHRVVVDALGLEVLGASTSGQHARQMVERRPAFGESKVRVVLERPARVEREATRGEERLHSPQGRATDHVVAEQGVGADARALQDRGELVGACLVGEHDVVVSLAWASNRAAL